LIEYLHIRDLAIIDEIEVELGEGFNVITGETGAGKSILVQGLSLLRGGRATSQMVRTGAASARVEAVIRPARTQAVAELLERLGVEDGDELTVTRVISPGGRGRVRINGELSTVTVLGKLVSALVDLTGQHDQQSLAITANHRSMVDGYGVAEKDRLAFAKAYGELKQVCSELDALPVDPAERATRQEVLGHQIEELRAANVQPDEETTLENERRKLASVAELEAVSRQGVDTLYAGSDSVTDALARICRSLESWASVEEMFEALAQRLEESRLVCEDVALELRSYVESLESDPGRLEEVEERLLMLASLKRKHRCATLAELVDRREELERELADLEAHEERIVALHRRLEDARREADEAARTLSRARKKTSKKLEKEVEQVLGELGMESTTFKIDVEELEARDDDDPRLCFGNRRLTSNGWDRVEMKVSSNPGEPPLSVRQVASGGELSRILLAVKAATARSDTVSSYVFDEVDTGIGGPVGGVVGRKLAKIADHRQVLCVTHLAQIAAHAQRHFVVSKVTTEGRARSMIRPLADEERAEGLARMMSTTRKVTKKAREHASELLKRAGKAT
jgi:DNA repair protein RecN (Recombination protein N)